MRRQDRERDRNHAWRADSQERRQRLARAADPGIAPRPRSGHPSREAPRGPVRSALPECKLPASRGDRIGRCLLYTSDAADE